MGRVTIIKPALLDHIYIVFKTTKLFYTCNIKRGARTEPNTVRCCERLNFSQYRNPILIPVQFGYSLHKIHLILFHSTRKQCLYSSTLQLHTHLKNIKLKIMRSIKINTKYIYLSIYYDRCLFINVNK